MSRTEKTEESNASLRMRNCKWWEKAVKLYKGTSQDIGQLQELVRQGVTKEQEGSSRPRGEEATVPEVISERTESVKGRETIDKKNMRPYSTKVATVICQRAENLATTYDLLYYLKAVVY